MGLFSKKPTSGGVDYIIVGLGNPEKKYDNTRHNVGFCAVDTIAQKYNTNIDRVKFKALTNTVTIDGVKCLLMKPTTYMNLSGESVVMAMNFYKIQPENVVIIFDDISLDVGKMRIRMKGSHGGHNGMKNIINLSGKDTFPRIKIGVGAKPHPDYDLAKWVLSSFPNEDKKTMDEVYGKCPEIIKLITSDQSLKAMNLYNK